MLPTHQQLRLSSDGCDVGKLFYMEAKKIEARMFADNLLSCQCSSAYPIIGVGSYFFISVHTVAAVSSDHFGPTS